jgi:hypothetical protein
MPRMLWHREKDFRKRENQMSENLLPCPSSGVESFQKRVDPWMQECFGPEISSDIVERNHRFLEEALELVQSTGCTKHEANQLVEYVFSRPVGETPQEAGGCMVTLAALCSALKIDMHTCGETELARIWGKVEMIRAKHAAKPKHSPLPAQPCLGIDHNVSPDPIPEPDARQRTIDQLVKLGHDVQGIGFTPAQPEAGKTLETCPFCKKIPTVNPDGTVYCYSVAIDCPMSRFGMRAEIEKHSLKYCTCDSKQPATDAKCDNAALEKREGV